MPWNYAQLDDGTSRVVPEDPSIVHDANFTSPISIDGVPSIDEADRLTIADIFDQITYVAEHMVKDHIFEDGNKRTSLVFALSVLRLADAPVVLSDAPEPKDNQYYAWIQNLVTGSRTRADLADELRHNCVVRPDSASHV